jgi:hypothetical protein
MGCLVNEYGYHGLRISCYTFSFFNLEKIRPCGEWCGSRFVCSLRIKSREGLLCILLYDVKSQCDKSFSYFENTEIQMRSFFGT